jgi:hypothetical protein
MNTITFLKGVICNPSDWATCFDINYEFFVYLKTLKQHETFELIYECRPNIILKYLMYYTVTIIYVL